MTKVVVGKGGKANNVSGFPEPYTILCQRSNFDTGIRHTVCAIPTTSLSAKAKGNDQLERALNNPGMYQKFKPFGQWGLG
jgi:uncharacterized protein (DUF2237 family)